MRLDILACSGPGAMEVIYRSITIGNYCAAMATVVVVALAYDHLRNGYLSGRLAWAVALLVLHPAWTVSALSGDCGGTKVMCSLLVTLVLGWLLVRQYLEARPNHPIDPTP